jgi:hypothetical protein
MASMLEKTVCNGDNAEGEPTTLADENLGGCAA